MSGAGTGAADGVYLRDGEFDDRPLYRLSGPARIYWQDDNWRIIDAASELLYRSDEDVAEPWDVIFWTVVEGNVPAPSVTEYTP